jgi:sugar/nucleoside kinase (ribokinase family)
LLQRLAALGPAIVIITDGTHGSYALHDRDAWFMPPFPIRAVERTGAGDAFSTGFLAALAQGTGIAEALRWETGNAGSVIQYIGPQAGLLTRPKMRRLLRAHQKLVAKPL